MNVWVVLQKRYKIRKRWKKHDFCFLKVIAPIAESME
jgi:hypothetical protein